MIAIFSNIINYSKGALFYYFNMVYEYAKVVSVTSSATLGIHEYHPANFEPEDAGISFIFQQ